MAGIETYLEQIKSAIYGKDVRQAIHDGIHQCYEDGKVGAVDLIARERISNLAQLQDGSTTGDAELIDARTVAAKAYPTLHDAVNSINDGLIGYQNGELVLPIIDGGYISDSDGSVVSPYNNWSYTDYISLSNIGTLTELYTAGAGTSKYNAFYDENKNFISSITVPKDTPYAIPIPSNAAYVRFSNQTAVLRNSTTVKYKIASEVGSEGYEDVKLTTTSGGYIGADGNIVEYANWSYTDFISLDNADGISAFINVSGQEYANYNAFYDENQLFIKTFPIKTNIETFVNIPQGAKYVRFSNSTAVINASTSIKFKSKGAGNFPFKIRVMQNNIGHFRWGYVNAGSLETWGLEGATYLEKLANYKKLFAEYQPNLLTLQEYSKFMDKAQTKNAKNVLFDGLFPFASIDDSTDTPNVVFANGSTGTFASVSFTGSDPVSGRSVATPVSVGVVTFHGVPIKVVSGALYSGTLQTASGDEAIRAGQWGALLDYLADQKYVIIGMDLNVWSDAELTSLLNIAKAKGFIPANGDYFGREVTYVSHATTPIETASQYYLKTDNILVKGAAKIVNFKVTNDFVVPDETATYPAGTPIRATTDLLASDHIPMVADIVFY